MEADRLRAPNTKAKRAGRKGKEGSTRAVCAISTGQLDFTGRVMKGVHAQEVTRRNWSGRGPDA